MPERWDQVSENHLKPHRGWALIREGGIPTLAETYHLENCDTCRGWLSSFADLARNAGFTIRFGTPCPDILNEHFGSERGWLLIRDGGALTDGEIRHLEHCRACNEWLDTFAQLARKAGFRIAFEIPSYKLPRRRQAA